MGGWHSAKWRDTGKRHSRPRQQYTWKRQRMNRFCLNTLEEPSEDQYCEGQWLMEFNKKGCDQIINNVPCHIKT